MDMPVACHLANRTACTGVFHADNGTAEVAAAGRDYAGKISMIKAVQSKYEKRQKPQWRTASSVITSSYIYPAAFSAVCWYTGKALFNELASGGGAGGKGAGTEIPVGLMQTSVGGSPIEYWLPPNATFDVATTDGTSTTKTNSFPVNVNACERDVPQCDNQFNDSYFFVDIVQQLVPHTFGSFVWDQAERDVKCPTSLAKYACMQRLLLSSWRSAFRSPKAVFVAVQLPGYTAAINNGTGSYPGFISGEMVQEMRLQQAAGTTGGGVVTANASYVATYDLSCPTSPFGSVHNPEKGPIGDRIAAKLVQLRSLVPNAASRVTAGPRALSAAALYAPSLSSWQVVVQFSGGSSPFFMTGTKNCTTCCGGSAPTGKTNDSHTLDFDVAFASGGVYRNTTGATIDPKTGTVTLLVAGARDQTPTLLRYTAASIWPQCALYNSERLPALPFTMAISSHADDGEKMPPHNASCDVTDVPLESYHIHILFSAANASQVQAALKFQLQFMTAYDLLGKANCTMTAGDPAAWATEICAFEIDWQPAGPFLTAQYSFFIPKKDVLSTIAWSVRHRGGLDVLLHPNSGCEVEDHTKWALWGGKKLQLDTSIFSCEYPGCVPQ